MSHLEQAQAERAKREEADKALAELHLAMMQEIGAASEDKSSGHWMPKTVGGAWELAGGKQPTNADLYIAALRLLFRLSCAIDPRPNETPNAYVGRAMDWIGDCVRKERGR